MDDASRNQVGVKIFSRMPETQLKSSVKFFYLAMRASEARNGPERLLLAMDRNRTPANHIGRRRS
jgi:hypothetical protein